MTVDEDRAAILAHYECSRTGHLERDPAKFLAQYGTAWCDLRDGTIVERMFDVELARTADFLAQTSFVTWDNLRPPRVEVAEDGSMAWLLAEIRATALQTQSDGTAREITYRCAWLQVYERQDGRWVAVVNAPTVRVEQDAHS